MRIRQACTRCGRVFSETDIRGGDQTFAMLQMSPRMQMTKLCPFCGGTVRGYEEGAEPPGEFRITRGGLLRATISSVVGWCCFSFVSGFTAQSDGGLQKLDDAARSAAAMAMWKTAWQFAAFGALPGVLVLGLCALLASRRDDIDLQVPECPMPIGQALSLLPMLVVGAILGASMAVWMVPPFVHEAISLRPLAIRILIGALAGVMASGWSHRALFKACRASPNRHRHLSEPFG